MHTFELYRFPLSPKAKSLLNIRTEATLQAVEYIPNLLSTKIENFYHGVHLCPTNILSKQAMDHYGKNQTSQQRYPRFLALEAEEW
ncbi:hypothetical protein CVS40_12657 [Lucilia cuprina]|nr:hypothetical protein CVS40_12657 [Lucilia cuprina]